MEVVILKLFTLAATTTFCISVALANPKLNFASEAMADDIPFKVNYSPVDYEFGKELSNFYSDLSKNEFKQSSVNKFIQLKNKNHAFGNLSNMVNRAELISKIKDQDSFYQNCSIEPKNINEFTENLAQRMDIALDKYCRFKFLKNLTKLSSDINFSARDLAYFKDASAFFVAGENQTEVTAFLKHFSSNKPELTKISDLLISKYIEFKIKPTSAILVNLQVSTLLNNFLQDNLHLDKNSSGFFQEEYQRMIRESQDTVEKGEYPVAKQQTIAAITFYSKNKKFIDDKKAWNLANLAAKSFYYKGRDSDAIEIFALAKAMAPKEETSEANFYLLWPHLINKDYRAMKAVIEKANLEKNFDNFDAKLQYWISYAFLRTGDSKK
ncbi:MAG: hypothetical protein K2Q18_09985, partial [Bdellovibrionales bacterium]|nr:hypothetical protein [Bdellovibrionales bacterium]